MSEIDLLYVVLAVVCVMVEWRFRRQVKFNLMLLDSIETLENRDRERRQKEKIEESIKNLDREMSRKK
jgi:hypothetical protein